jgi:hypothetical protein
MKLKTCICYNITAFKKSIADRGGTPLCPIAQTPCKIIALENLTILNPRKAKLFP